MTSPTDLFEALSASDFEADDPRRALVDAPLLLEGAVPVAHPALRAVRRQFFTAIKAVPLTLLIGLSGVGKTRLVDSVVRRINRLLGGPGRVPAVGLVAPTAQRQAFSWKAFWVRALEAVHDPLPAEKVDPVARAAELRRRFGGASSRIPEWGYFDKFCGAALERGMRLLVIDEASALARSESGVTLLDQIAVLRELADKELFRIVLVSTFGILRDLRRSGVLDRRMRPVVFPRYAEALVPAGPDGAPSRQVDVTDEGFLAFRNTAHSFMARLPEASRLELQERHFVELWRGSLGCVGQLCDWYKYAVWECIDSGDSRLRWRHFEESPLPVDRRGNLVLEARCAGRELRLLRDRRLDLTEDELAEIALAEAKADRAAVSRPRSRTVSAGLAPRRAKKGSSPRKRGSRPGVPEPHSRALPS